MSVSLELLSSQSMCHSLTLFANQLEHLHENAYLVVSRRSLLDLSKDTRQLNKFNLFAQVLAIVDSIKLGKQVAALMSLSFEKPCLLHYKLLFNY